MKVYERPIVRGSDKQATVEEKRIAEVLLAELDEITSAFMIRRAGKDFLASELPPRFEVLMFCDLSDVQSNLYTSFTSSSRNINLDSDISGDALAMVMQLRLLCSHPDLVTDESSASFLKSSKGDIDLSGKMVVLSQLLKSIRSANPLDKVVIVSNFTSVLSFIETYIFEANKWSFLRLDGQVELTKRQSIVDAFNRGNASSSFAFLLSAKAGGCGLNLIGGKGITLICADFYEIIDPLTMI
jgi:DNA repair and recombination RAD54-like protein